MRSRTIFLVILVIGIIIIFGLVFWKGQASPYLNPDKTASSTPQISTSTPATLDQSISDGVITFTYSSQDFGLATNQTQILVHPYIPPCDSQFNYCLYYNDTTYNGTNFESAGIRIQKRTDLANERVCLNTPPQGFDSKMVPNATSSDATYSSSVFSNIGTGAAGHIASGSLYRLYVREKGVCYEFETRIGQSQFQNYPAGSIREFTQADAAEVQSLLKKIVNSISLPTKENNLFP